jgi:hypothetical protein
MTSPRQRAANRANARKSTGPRSAQGRQRASLNATKHGLARPIDASPWGEHAPAMEALLCADGYSETEAQDIARKILDYERNLDFQRQRFKETVADGGNTSDTAAGKFDETSAADQLDAAVLEAFGPLAADLWVAETLEKRAKAKKPLFEEKLDLEIAKFFRKTVENKLRIARNEELEKLRSVDRHLRRSALQLSKALRSSKA